MTANSALVPLTLLLGMMTTACTSSESQASEDSDEVQAIPALSGDQLAEVRIGADPTSEAADRTTGFALTMTPGALDAPGQWDAWLACGAEDGTTDTYEVLVSDNLHEDVTWVRLAATETVEGPGEYAATLARIGADDDSAMDAADGTMRIDDGLLSGEFDVAADGVRLAGTWECTPAP